MPCWIPSVAKGELLAAFALTEPDAGSDAGATRTTARLEGDPWVINGTKQFITNAGTDITGLMLVTAVTGDPPAEGRRSEISMLLVPAGTPGLIVGAPYAKMGWRCSETRPVTFEDCRVPRENLVGERGRGLGQMPQMLDGGRIGVAANALGLAQARYDAAARYAHERRQFGRPISSFQAIQLKLADMATEIELARLIMYRAAALADVWRPYSTEAAMAKLHASETAKRAADRAVQIHGGYGFMDECAVSRYWRL